MYTIGIDLGGTNIAVGVVDENCKIIGRGTRKTDSPRAYESIFADIVAAAGDALRHAEADISQVRSMGLGTPGSVDKERGLIAYANNLDFHNVPAVKLLRERFKIPVYLENDANAAALGEARAGVGAGAKNFVMITLGTGVGSGIILDGKILTGINYAGGEMGHTVIVKDGKECNCGRRGCWEKYASARALVARTQEAMDFNKGSLMWKLCDGDINKVCGQTAFRAADKGDKVARNVVEKYISYLAAGITNIVNVFQPEMICIGGGVGREGENLLAPLREIVARERYSKKAEKQTKIVSAVLGNDAGILGAALLED
ncbi:MAG: ROK family protein [Oscillospiraceae bacterium]|nr:ROK family protein [Oscillospiraceae bacterium]